MVNKNKTYPIWTLHLSFEFSSQTLMNLDGRDDVILKGVVEVCRAKMANFGQRVMRWGDGDVDNLW